MATDDADGYIDNSVALPRIRITYCTQCRWMLRAAYFAQELLTTFSTSIGEIALVPATGGLFTVVLTYIPPQTETQTETAFEPSPKTVLLWDRKVEGGFPETKVLKQRVRDHIQTDKKLGHSDTPAAAVKHPSPTPQAQPETEVTNDACKTGDC